MIRLLFTAALIATSATASYARGEIGTDRSIFDSLAVQKFKKNKDKGVSSTFDGGESRSKRKSKKPKGSLEAPTGATNH